MVKTFDAVVLVIYLFHLIFLTDILLINMLLMCVLQLASFWCIYCHQMMLKCVAIWCQHCSASCHWYVVWVVHVGCPSLDLWPLLVRSQRQDTETFLQINYNYSNNLCSATYSTGRHHFTSRKAKAKIQYKI